MSSDADLDLLDQSLEALAAEEYRRFVDYFQLRPGQPLRADDALMEHLTRVWKRGLFEAAKAGARYQRALASRALKRRLPRERKNVQEIKTQAPTSDQGWDDDATTVRIERRR